MDKAGFEKTLKPDTILDNLCACTAERGEGRLHFIICIKRIGSSTKGNSWKVVASAYCDKPYG